MSKDISLIHELPAGATFHGGGQNVKDFERVLQNPSADHPAFNGMRLDGTNWQPTDNANKPNHPLANAFAPMFYPDRENSKQYHIGDYVNFDGYYFISTTDGTTGSTEPPVGDTVTDGTVTWVRNGRYQKPVGYLSEEARTNEFLHSGAAATQDITTTAGDYTVAVYGAGSVDLSGTVTGTVTEGNPVTFTATAGTLTCTVTGTPQFVQVEKGSFATSPILTTDTAVTRPATQLTIPSAGVLRENDIAIQGVVIPEGLHTVKDIIVECRSASSDGFNIAMHEDYLIFLVGSAYVRHLQPINSGVTYQYQAYLSSVSGNMGFRMRSFDGITWSSWSPWDEKPSGDMVNLQGEIYVGSSRPYPTEFKASANIPFFQTRFTDDPKAWLEANVIYPIVSPYQKNFTAQPTAGKTLKLTVSAPATTDVLIYWGEGLPTNVPAGSTNLIVTKTYQIAGDYDVSMTPEATYLKIEDVKVTGDVEWIGRLTGLKELEVKGSNTLSGNIASLPTQITKAYIYGANTTHGRINDLTPTLVEIGIKGHNTIDGDIGSSPAGMYYLDIEGLNRVSDYTTKHWHSPMQVVNVNPATGGLSTAEVDQLINDLSLVQWSGSKTITLMGDNDCRSHATDVTVALFHSEGVTVSVNCVASSADKFPSELSQCFVISDFVFQNIPNTIRSDVEVGVPKVRRRYTKPFAHVGASIVVDKDDMHIFNDFYHLNLKDGVDRFQFTDPITNTLKEYRFIDTHVISSIGGTHFKIAMNLEQLT